MAKDWTCYVCGEAVSWGTAICPLCGSALSWEEEDEEDPLAALMPPQWNEDDIPDHKRRVRRYALVAIGVGLLMAVLGVAAGASTRYLLLPGVLLAVAGLYGLATLPKRYL